VTQERRSLNVRDSVLVWHGWHKTHDDAAPRKILRDSQVKCRALGCIASDM
jgi:hypothetical protein